MAPHRKGRGRPTKEPRSNTVTVSIRYVSKEAMRRLHMAAADKHLTVGEVFSDLVLNSLKY